jgi:hypothetical protein
VYLLVGVGGFDSTYAPLVAAAAAIPVTFVVSRTIMLHPSGRRPERTGHAPETERAPVR